jgi:hypothetical protein
LMLVIYQRWKQNNMFVRLWLNIKID